MIDLNELPDDAIGEAPGTDGVRAEDPMFCTQPVPPHAGAGNIEGVAESPNPGVAQNAPVQEIEPEQTEGYTLDDTTTVGDTAALLGLVGADNDDEAWSQPKEPYVGMRFDTLEGAKEHYNAYALQLGFSIKMNT